MLPAAWVGWKGAGLAWKIGSIAVPIVLAVGLYRVGHWRGYHEGEQRTEERHAQQALTQATQVVEHTAKQAELSPAVLQEFIKDREASEKIRATLEQRIRDYERERTIRKAVLPRAQPQEMSYDEPRPICATNPDPLDESFVAHWDAIGRMFLEEEDAGGDRAVSAGDRDPGGVPEVQSADVQTATILRARAAEFDEYKRLRDHYDGLREFSKGVNIFQRTWQQQRQATEQAGQ